MWKTLSIIAALLLAGAGAVSHLKKQDVADARKEFEQAKENRGGLGGKVEEAEKAVKDRQGELAAAEEKSEADAKTLSDLEEQKASLTSDLDARDTAKADAEAALSGMEEKIAVVGKIEELKTIITQLQAEKRGAEAKVANLKSQLSSAISEKNSTDAELNRVKKIELDKASGRMNGSFTTRVGTVDSSWRYITIAAGDGQGVVKDAILDVVRSGDVVGKVKVSNVEPSRSAADVVPGSFVEGSTIRPGDLLRVAPESRSK
jgi:chromosome segregation ATPase